jgi:long-subunit fatty acid transport protein
MQICGIAQALTANGISTTQYSHDVQFEGSSLFLGFQGAVTYKVNDMLSLSAGLRYVSATNTYNGFLKDIMINPNQQAFGAQFNGVNMVAAPVFFNAASATLAGWAAGATAYVTGLQPIITGGGGLVPLANGTSVGLTQEQIGQIMGLVQAAGQDPAGITIQQAQAILNAAAPIFSATSSIMASNAAMSSDIDVDAKQTGSGFAPLFGFTLRPTEDLVIGFKYEHKTPLTLLTETVVDGTGMFPNGKEVHNDMPSMFSLGVSYQVSPQLRLSGTGHYYLDRSANYGKEINNVAVDNTQVIDKNYWEAAFGAEYQLSSEFMLSLGYLRTTTGVNANYQSDLSHSLNTNTIAGGFRYAFSDKTALNLGVMNTWYAPDTKAFTGFSDTYKRSAFVFGFGVDFSL